MSNKKKATTLLEAAKRFTEETYEQSAMRQVIINFAKYKEATRILVRELDMINKDLG